MIVEIKDDFDIKKIAESGQCFRWNETKDGEYRVIHDGRCVYIRELNDGEDANDDKKTPVISSGAETCFNSENKRETRKFSFDCSGEDFESVWKPYLDLDESYENIRKQIDREKDPFLYEASEYEKGIRILRQDSWETLVSFIISQNRNIPAIKNSIELLCVFAGDKRIDSRGEDYFTFPTPEAVERLDDEALGECRLGYRDKYVKAAARAVLAKEPDLDELDGIADDAELEKRLMKMYGIGKKVADCICLFGFHRLDFFPVDVWVKRILAEHYAGGYPYERYAPFNGVCQQYMFAYYRNVLSAAGK